MFLDIFLRASSEYILVRGPTRAPGASSKGGAARIIYTSRHSAADLRGRPPLTFGKNIFSTLQQVSLREGACRLNEQCNANVPFATLITLTVLFLVMGVHYSFAQDTKTIKVGNSAAIILVDSTQNAKLTQKSPRGAFVRSLAFPGWGQWYNEQKIKAVLAFSVESFLIGLALYYNKRAGGSMEEEFYTDRRNGAYWWLLGAALISGVDAYIDAYLYDFDTGPDLELRVGALPGSRYSVDRAMFGLSFRATA